MKIDVDGYDLKVLEGAVNLLTSSRPIIFGEFMKHCLAWHGQSHDDVVDFVRQFDYKVFSKDRSAWRFLSCQEYNVESDLLIAPILKKFRIYTGACLSNIVLIIPTMKSGTFSRLFRPCIIARQNIA